MLRAPHRTLAVLVAPLLLALACGGSGGSGGAPYAVETSERVWVDASRATPATFGARGAPERTLRVILHVPDARGPRPLVVAAHGYGGHAERLTPFLEQLAESGYVVAAPVFPLTNLGAPGGYEQGIIDYPSQPADLSFVIDRVLAASGDPGDPLSGRVDRSAVAIFGHSLGGATALGTLAKDCCRDPRVRAAVLAGVPWPVSLTLGLDAIDAAGRPTLVLHGTADETVDYGFGLDLYGRLGAPRWFVGMSGALHSPMFESSVEPPIPSREVAQRVVVAFLDQVLGGAPRLDATLDALEREGHVVLRDPGG